MEPNDNSFYAQEKQQELLNTSETVGRYTAKAFLWMFAGLMVTFAVSLASYGTLLVYYIFSIPYAPIVLLLAEVAVVWILAGRIHKMSINAARALFLFYAVLNGVVFSAYFELFELPSLVLVFAATALYFGGMAVFGYVTKADLSRLRNVLLGGLVFLILFGVLSMFIPGLAFMDRAICLIGVAVFLAFTAYDTQKIKAYYAAYQGDEAMLKKASIFSALDLYLDFVNLFLYLLRLLGKRK